MLIEFIDSLYWVLPVTVGLWLLGYVVKYAGMLLSATAGLFGNGPAFVTLGGITVALLLIITVAKWLFTIWSVLYLLTVLF